jgi:hypothetical protein
MQQLYTATLQGCHANMDAGHCGGQGNMDMKAASNVCHAFAVGMAGMEGTVQLRSPLLLHASGAGKQ